MSNRSSRELRASPSGRREDVSVTFYYSAKRDVVLEFTKRGRKLVRSRQAPVEERIPAFIDWIVRSVMGEIELKPDGIRQWMESPMLKAPWRTKQLEFVERLVAMNVRYHAARELRRQLPDLNPPVCAVSDEASLRKFVGRLVGTARSVRELTNVNDFRLPDPVSELKRYGGNFRRRGEDSFICRCGRTNYLDESQVESLERIKARPIMVTCERCKHEGFLYSTAFVRENAKTFRCVQCESAAVSVTASERADLEKGSNVLKRCPVQGCGRSGLLVNE